MALTPTQFVIQGAPIDPAFEGSLQEFFEHILERCRIVAPFGISTFITGTQIPSSNQGPLLLTTSTGTGWWVWDDDAKTYVPQDLTEALEQNYFFSPTEPENPSVLFWIQTDFQGRVINYWIKGADGAWYSPTGGRGPTESRPTSPADYTRYWDTSINAELIFERGAWRTVSGVPGDIKFVGTSTLTEALRLNPGWRELSTSSLGPAVRGRALVPAHKDPGPTPETDNPPVAGVSVARYASEAYGQQNIVLENDQVPGHPETHWHGVGVMPFGNDNPGILLRPYTETNGFIFEREFRDGSNRLRGIQGQASSNYFITGYGEADQAVAQNEGWVTTAPKNSSDTNDPPEVESHGNEGPRIALWSLIKE
jgi:hypothetical protein